MEIKIWKRLKFGFRIFTFFTHRGSNSCWIFSLWHALFRDKSKKQILIYVLILIDGSHCLLFKSNQKNPMDLTSYRAFNIYNGIGLERINFQFQDIECKKRMEESQTSASPNTLIHGSNLFVNNIYLSSSCQSSQDKQSLLNVPLIIVFKF